MKKLSILALVFGLTAAAHAQAPFGLPVTALGYDADLGHVTARLPLGSDALDVGAAVVIDNTENNPFAMGLSAYYLKKTNAWGPVSLFLVGGGALGITHASSDNFVLSGFAGFQPELTLMERLALSTRFGVSLDVLPDFILGTAGPANGLSVVQAMSFKILF